MAKIYKVDGKFEIVNLESSGGGGAVDSVNGQTGAVVLDAADVGADVSGAAATAQSNAESYTDSEVALRVPYTGATTDVDLGSNDFAAKKITGSDDVVLSKNNAVIQGNAGTNGLILKNLKNDVVTLLGGTPRTVELNILGTPYYFLVYPSSTLWTAYRSITIDHTLVGSSDSTDFPVLISGTYSYLATVANGGDVQNANGYDIGFYSDSGLTTKLKWETEFYDATTGTVSYWVKIPTLSHTSDTVIYIAYGNPSITTDQSDPTNVWDSGFQGVYHLPNGTMLSTNDSTSYANNGTNHGATATGGEIDGAAAFGGSAYVDCGDMSGIEAQSYLTVSFWIYHTATISGTIAYIGKFNGTTNTQILFVVENAINTNCVLFAVGKTTTDSNTYGYTASSVLTNSQWDHVVCVFNGTQSTNATKCVVYVNGVAKALTFVGTFGTVTTSTTSNLTLGATSDLSRKLTGSLDEVRISNVARSSDWIIAEYNNQNNPSGFYTISSPL